MKFLVTPEELVRTSQEFSTCGQNVNTITQQMLEIVRSMSSTWSGEANTAYTTKFNGLDDDMQKIFKMIQEHVSDLQEIAKNFQNAENLNVETSGALNNNIL